VAVIKLPIPVRPFSAFVKSAHKWLSKTYDAKSGIEIALCPRPGGYELVASCSQHLIQGFMKAEGSEQVDEPLCMDLNFLAAFAFNTDNLQLLKPIRKSADERFDRIQFQADTFKFKIPHKNGQIIESALLGLEASKKIEHPLVLDLENFHQIYPHMSLPDSFKLQTSAKLVVIDRDPIGVVLHWYDGLGAFCHTFKKELFKTLPDFKRMVLTLDLFGPLGSFGCRKGEIRIFESQTLQKIEVDCTDTTFGITNLLWIAPRRQDGVQEIPAALQAERKSMGNTIRFKTGFFKAGIDQVLSFSTDLKETGIDFSALGKQFTLSVACRETEAVHEGELAEDSVPIRTRFTASSLKDYVGELDTKLPFHMEMFASTVAIVQANELGELVYWLPTKDRG
jgi:hypothetical protein